MPLGLVSLQPASDCYASDATGMIPQMAGQTRQGGGGAERSLPGTEFQRFSVPNFPPIFWLCRTRRFPIRVPLCL